MIKDNACDPQFAIDLIGGVKVKESDYTSAQCKLNTTPQNMYSHFT